MQETVAESRTRTAPDADVFFSNLSVLNGLSHKVHVYGITHCTLVSARPILKPVLLNSMVVINKTPLP